jgi:hypothetical protein
MAGDGRSSEGWKLLANPLALCWCRGIENDVDNHKQGSFTSHGIFNALFVLSRG